MKKLLKIKKKRQIRKCALYVLSLLFIATFIYSFVYVDKKIKPTVGAIAEAKAQELANRAINNAVGDILKDQIKYEELINLKTDNEGNITMMQANTILMNKLASNIAIDIQEKLKHMKTTSAYIPLGTAFDSQILAQYGPQLKVGIEPVGLINVDFGTEFESSGINQTRHRIYLIITSRVKVIIPLISSTKEVVTRMPVCETVVVGKVPDTFISIPKEEVPRIIDEYKDKSKTDKGK